MEAKFGPKLVSKLGFSQVCFVSFFKNCRGWSLGTMQGIMLGIIARGKTH